LGTRDLIFVPQNELEHALLAAATDPSARPHFYEVLARADLLVIDDSPGPALPEGPLVLETGRPLQVRQIELEGVLHTPVFSSSLRISAFVNRQVRTLAMNAKALFEITAGDHLVLNPASDYGKQFTPEETAQVVDGSIFSPRNRIVVPEARQVLLGQPANYPTHVTNPLAAFFKTRKSVRAAYLAHVLDPKSGDAPHTMIGVDVDDGADYDQLMGQAATVLGGVAQKDEVIDFIRITRDGISDYMTKETKPFYKRKWLGLF
jgi:hypothetical protein